jgi:Spy/CpxP family protein refolding chaperone
VDITDTYFVQNTYYRMSSRLGRTEDDIDVKNVVDEAQKYYNAQEKREWVEWASKILMPQLHAQMAMEQVDVTRAEQESRRQDEKEQRDWEQVQKEAELEEREMEYIRQVDAKEIDEVKFRELVNELDMERVMAESVAEGPATTQDEEVGESEREESAEEAPEAAAISVESSTVGKGKRKAVPARAKVYAEMDGLVSNLIHHRQSALT